MTQEKMPKDKHPKISIITPSYNQGDFIEETILSVINQNYPNYEHIIIDGASTDKTLSVLRKYKRKIRYISEEDEGQVVTGANTTRGASRPAGAANTEAAAWVLPRPRAVVGGGLLKPVPLAIGAKVHFRLNADPIEVLLDLTGRGQR